MAKTKTKTKSPARLDAEIASFMSKRDSTKSLRFMIPAVGPRGQMKPPASGFVRLYRGGSRGGLENVADPTHGQWFTTRLGSARDYAGVTDEGPLPPGAVILVIDVHGTAVARMPRTSIEASGYAPIPISDDDQAWLRSAKSLKEWGPPDVEVRVPVVVARAATRLQGRARDVPHAKPQR